MHWVWANVNSYFSSFETSGLWTLFVDFSSCLESHSCRSIFIETFCLYCYFFTVVASNWDSDVFADSVLLCCPTFLQSITHTGEVTIPYLIEGTMVSKNYCRMSLLDRNLPESFSSVTVDEKHWIQVENWLLVSQFLTYYALTKNFKRILNFTSR